LNATIPEIDISELGTILFKVMDEHQSADE